jgi:DNA repair protein SbcD/Mre11
LTAASAVPLRVLHTSDLHIGDDSLRRSDGAHQTVCMCPLLAVIAIIDRLAPDAVVVAGDLFDHSRLAPEVLRQAAGVLAATHVPCAVIPGNHDLGRLPGPYLDFTRETAGTLTQVVTAADGELITVIPGRLALWARSMQEHWPGFRPLVGAPARPHRAERYVVAGHGHYVGDGQSATQAWSSPITADDITGTGADYVALGHWHVTSRVGERGVEAWYSGSPLMSGTWGNVLLVTLTGGGCQVEAVPLKPPSGGCHGIGDPASGDFTERHIPK